jgi:type VI secretion system protein ImpH
LYGVSSPLPPYYTEDLLAEAREGKHATRDFLDIVHYTIYPLLYDAWRKYRLQLRALEDGDETASNLLFSFIGLADPALRASLPFAATGLLRYAGVLNQRPRSAQGLYTILSDSFSSATVTVQPCQLRAEQIAPEQRWQLGVGAQGLGESLYLGEEIEEGNSVVLVQFSDLSLSLYRQLLPGQPAWQQLVFLTRFYLTDPLEVDVTLSMNIDERLPWQLGQAESSCLGQDAWLVPSRAPLDCCVRYTI